MAAPVLAASATTAAAPNRAAPAKGSPVRAASATAGKLGARGAAGLQGGLADQDEAEDEVELRRQRSFFDLAPSWLISLVIHLMLMLILALTISPAGEHLGNVLLTIGQSDRESPSELAEFSIAQESDLIDPADAMALDSLVNVDALDFSHNSIETAAPELATIDEGLGREILPMAPMVSGRSGAMRKTLLTLYGGTAETEAAVELGLKWLAKQQHSNGSWSLKGPYDDGAPNDIKSAATAMALLAFLGAGNTHQSGEYKQVVHKGIQWLVKQQDRDGYFAKEGQSHQRTYAQAQCSIVVSELYAMTKDSWLREPAQLAMKYAEKAQAEKGGWRYRPREAGDTSVTGWYVMALQSGASAGLEIDRSTFYRTSQFLDTVQHDGGATYSYQPYGAPQDAMTAEGLLCRQYLGWTREEPAMARGVTRLVNDWPFNSSDPNFYYWYYASQTLHHYGGSEWREWNNVMREELPKMQVRHGKETGSWAPQRDRWGSSGGRLYSTCFAIYCLEVYYRHMPLYRPSGEG